MSHCTSCGAKLPEGATYCPQCGKPIDTVAQQILAGWGTRFVAWLIDIIILGIILGSIKLVTFIAWPSVSWAPDFVRWIPFVDFGMDNVVYFLYWMLMEGVYGQSIGKMILGIKVTQLKGNPANIAQTAIQSIGKAFVLPIDCIIGWILYPTKRQRLFSHLSETIVVKAYR
jgi:uncharacterized RDD family membrane protein YckC